MINEEQAGRSSLIYHGLLIQFSWKMEASEGANRICEVGPKDLAKANSPLTIVPFFISSDTFEGESFVTDY